MEEKTCYFRAEMEITRFTDDMFTVTASDCADDQENIDCNDIRVLY